jgi:hypothetical protein
MDFQQYSMIPLKKNKLLSDKGNVKESDRPKFGIPKLRKKSTFDMDFLNDLVDSNLERDPNVPTLNKAKSSTPEKLVFSRTELKKFDSNKILGIIFDPFKKPSENSTAIKNNTTARNSLGPKLV